MLGTGDKVEREGQNAKGTGAEIEGGGKKEGPQGQASGRIRLRDNAQNRLEAGKITPALGEVSS